MRHIKRKMLIEKREKDRKKITKKVKCDRRAKVLLRVRRHRLKCAAIKKTPEKSTNKNAHVYSKPQSLGKAVSRVNQALPNSPRKK